MKDKFIEVSEMLPPFRENLSAVPGNIASKAYEIRVRAGRPVTVETPRERYVCGGNGASVNDIFCCIKLFCDYSIYSCERELSEGWITLKGGHRAGFSGTANIRNGAVQTIRDISSLNIRIAREHKGIAEKLLSHTAFERDFKGLLIIGAPLSGKTTYLRDYCRLLSQFRKTVLIDERSEIAAVYNGIPQNDTGANCDVMSGFPKKDGIIKAMRSLSPEYIICDEVTDEYDEIAECACKGIKLVASMHCGSIDEAAGNSGIKRLVDSGAVNYIVFLENGSATGKINGLWRVDNSGDICSCGSGNNMYVARNTYVVCADKTM